MPKCIMFFLREQCHFKVQQYIAHYCSGVFSERNDEQLTQENKMFVCHQEVF